jgi:phenylacetate-coenzyme A ligase PaaK-like adenylate-forming protein
MTATFVSPTKFDAARLETAMAWFDRASARTPGSVVARLDEASWRTVAFTHKPDLRTLPRPYPETGAWIASLHSSGTTGEPVFSPWSECDQQIADATACDLHARCPSIAGARCAVIAPGPPLAVAHFMLREIEMSGGAAILVEPADPERIWRTLIDSGVEVVFTLPLVASRLAEYFQATRHHAPAGIQLVFCAGDVLSPARQSMLTTIWEARVLNMFGCSELFGPLAGPGEEGGPLVWRCEPVAVEVIDPESMSSSRVGQRGVLVITTLWPKARPLQRYWTDDIVEVTQTGPVDGVFGFHYIGRPPSMLQTPVGRVPLRDIDNMLLHSGWCGSEWSVRESVQGLCVRAEMLTPTAGAVRQLTDALADMLGQPVEFDPAEIGLLPRTAPKFRVYRSGGLSSNVAS